MNWSLVMAFISVVIKECDFITFLTTKEGEDGA
jgi:hypothetical protein